MTCVNSYRLLTASMDKQQQSLERKGTTSIRNLRDFPTLHVCINMCARLLVWFQLRATFKDNRQTKHKMPMLSKIQQRSSTAVSNWTCLFTEEETGDLTKWGKTDRRHCDDLITFFRTSSSLTAQLADPPGTILSQISAATSLLHGNEQASNRNSTTPPSLVCSLLQSLSLQGSCV